MCMLHTQTGLVIQFTLAPCQIDVQSRYFLCVFKFIRLIDIFDGVAIYQIKKIKSVFSAYVGKFSSGAQPQSALFVSMCIIQFCGLNIDVGGGIIGKISACSHLTSGSIDIPIGLHAG